MENKPQYSPLSSVGRTVLAAAYQHANKKESMEISGGTEPSTYSSPRRGRAFSWSFDRETTSTSSSRGSKQSAHHPLSRISRKFLRKRSSGERENDSECQILESWLVESHEFRYNLVNRALAEHWEGGATKVRFIVAVVDYQETNDKKEKSLKRQQIKSIFLNSSSQYCLKDLSSMGRKSMFPRGGKTTTSRLIALKECVLEDIVENPIVQSLLAEAQGVGWNESIPEEEGKDEESWTGIE